MAEISECIKNQLENVEKAPKKRGRPKGSKNGVKGDCGGLSK